MTIFTKALRILRGASLVLFIAMLGHALWGPATGAAQNPGSGQNSPRPVVAYATRTDTTVPLRHMPQIQATRALDRARAVPS